MYKDELKIIDTQEKAYLLGQLFGDGYSGNINNSYKCSLASINTDKEVYEELNRLFPFFKLTTFKSHENMIYLQCFSKNLYLDLLKHGMISNKTEKDLTKEFHFPNIDKSLLCHFIRGYFDADGSAWLPSRIRSRNNLHIEFGCATKNFLLELKKVLDENDIRFTWLERSKKAGNGKYYKSYILFSSNKNISLKFADFIYKDASIYLKYKFDKCYNSFNYKDPVFNVYGSCPYCQSNHIIKRGLRDNKQRLLCVSCNKHFTRPLPN